MKGMNDILFTLAEYYAHSSLRLAMSYWNCA